VVVPGPVTERLGAAARAAGAQLVMGIDEREAHGGTVYNTLLYFDADGRLLGKHRKLVPTHAERLVWGMGDGSDLQVHQTTVGRVGGLICWENYMPLARFADVPDTVPDRDRLWRGAEPHGDWMLDGYSVIVDPTGKVLAGPLVREEGILYAELDLDAARARHRLFDPVGHYNRPDVFRLVVDDRPKPHLVSVAGSRTEPPDPVVETGQVPEPA
jgi:nitrilase